jgi:hypothetical protein
MGLYKLLRKLALFFIPIIIAAFILEMTLRSIPNDYKFKKQQLLMRSDSIEILILGGSHTAYDIIPDYLNKNSFNLAYVSQTLHLDKLVFNRFKSQLPNLRVVILMMAYPTLSHKPNEGEESWRKFNYYRYYDIKPEQKLQAYYLELFNIPFNQNIDRIINYLTKKTILTCDSDGWFHNYTHLKSVDLEKTSVTAAKRHENGSQDFTSNLATLEELIETCRQDNIKVFILSMPLYKTYIKHLNPEKLAKTFNVTIQIANKYDNVEYLNFSSDPRFESLDFYDADHLNDLGAKKFTEILRDTLDLDF